MSNCVQSASESELDFCLRVMSLRERVVMLSGEEECPFDVVLLKKRFFHTMFTGLKHNNIRMKLQHTLKTGTLSDEALLNEISIAVSDESEHLQKFKSKVHVNEVNSSTLPALNSLKETKKNKDNLLFEENNKLCLNRLTKCRLFIIVVAVGELLNATIANGVIHFATIVLFVDPPRIGRMSMKLIKKKPE